MKFTFALAGILAQPFSTTAALKVERGRTTGSEIYNGFSATGISGFKQKRLLRSLLGIKNRKKDYGRLLLSRPLNNHNKDLPLRNLYSLSSGDGGKPCDPSSLDPDVGILSCGKGSLCKPNGNSFLRGTCVDAAPQQDSTHSSTKEGEEKVFTPGILKNQPHEDILLLTECDPTSTEAADVGVLGCGDGDRCLPNPSSGRGGYCEASSQNDADTSSRELVWLLVERGICNTTHPNYMYYDCDCSGYDNVTGTGSVPCTGNEFCLGLLYPGCTDLCLTKYVVYNFENFTSPSYDRCASTTKGASPPQTFCLFESFEDRTCELNFNDQLCNSCTVNIPPNPYDRYDTDIDFDCSNVDGASTGDGIHSISVLPALEECHEPLENPVPCYLCPGDNIGINYFFWDTLERTLIDVDGYGNFSCALLSSYSYYYNTISQDACPAVVSAINSTCCNPICQICPTGVPQNAFAMTNFSGYGEVSCYYLEALLAADPSKCAKAKPLLVDACCGSTIEPATLAPSTAVTSTEEDGVFRVTLSTWGAVMMMGSAGALMT